VSVTSSGLDLEDTLLNGEKRDIECSSSEIEDEDVLLTLGLLVETVSDSGGGGLVDDAENVESRDNTSILSGLTLRVVEVSGDGDDGVGDGGSEVSLSGFLHLEEDHGGDFLRSEFLSLSLVVDRDDGLGSLVDDLERPVCKMECEQRSVSGMVRGREESKNSRFMSDWTS